MKNLLIIALIFALFTACSSDKPEETEESKTEQTDVSTETKDSETGEDIYGNYELSGKIADKYPIYMNINVNEDKSVSGYYYYTSHKKKIKLVGTFSEESGFELNEWNKNKSNEEEHTGTFKFIENNGEYSGKWTNPQKTKTLSFHAKPGEPELAEEPKHTTFKEYLKDFQYVLDNHVTSAMGYIHFPVLFLNESNSKLIDDIDEFKASMVWDGIYGNEDFSKLKPSDFSKTKFNMEDIYYDQEKAIIKKSGVLKDGMEVYTTMMTISSNEPDNEWMQRTTLYFGKVNGEYQLIACQVMIAG